MSTSKHGLSRSMVDSCRWLLATHHHYLETHTLNHPCTPQQNHTGGVITTTTTGLARTPYSSLDS